ncbi:hypothetical protein [Sphingomonas sp. R1]|uniref:hypothetical protein n=1 Tax=Sphingomonas sp. R1 TaxID=399176 RepID=UPI002224B68E|nr:hypothetical protein [Sphingomonas sp. R1]UYY78556.1 hypothetical protein OIM94_06065 [Sphingomonas sp. R1]
MATNVRYYSELDERAFFDWLDRMPFVSGYRGVVRDLFIDLSRVPTDTDLWEILGFCRRYRVDVAQLEKFVTDENRHWLSDEIARTPSSADNR